MVSNSSKSRELSKITFRESIEDEWEFSSNLFMKEM